LAVQVMVVPYGEYAGLPVPVTERGATTFTWPRLQWRCSRGWQAC